ncbi:MAG: isoprenylcysteine carboxylmethyltransferase family protein [Candidatus Bathyarchaeia archaeon]
MGRRSMNSELTFRAIFAALVILASSVRAYYAIRVRKAGEKTSLSKRLREGVKREGKLSMALRLITAPFFVAVVILYPIYPQWVAWSALPLPTLLRWVGVGVGISSLLLLLWVHRSLGRYWSTELVVKEGHELVTSGPYRWVRHPMYSVSFTLFIALSIVSANWLLSLLTVITIISVYARIGKEEAMMVERFGDEYRDYMRRTGRLLPRLTRKAD